MKCYIMVAVVMLGARGVVADPVSDTERFEPLMADDIAALLSVAKKEGCNCNGPRLSDDAPASLALARIGSPAVPHLLKWLHTETNWSQQLRCLHTLALMGDEATHAVANVRQFLQTGPHPLVAKYSRAYVASLEADKATLESLLTDEHKGTRFVAAELLGRIGVAP